MLRANLADKLAFFTHGCLRHPITYLAEHSGSIFYIVKPKGVSLYYSRNGERDCPTTVVSRAGAFGPTARKEETRYHRPPWRPLQSIVFAILDTSPTHPHLLQPLRYRRQPWQKLLRPLRTHANTRPRRPPRQTPKTIQRRTIRRIRQPRLRYRLLRRTTHRTHRVHQATPRRIRLLHDGQQQTVRRRQGLEQGVFRQERHLPISRAQRHRSSHEKIHRRTRRAQSRRRSQERTQTHFRPRFHESFLRRHGLLRLPQRGSRRPTIPLLQPRTPTHSRLRWRRNGRHVLRRRRILQKHRRRGL